MKNVIAIIKNAWGDSPPPKVKTGFIPNPCDWEKKNYLTNPALTTGKRNRSDS